MARKTTMDAEDQAAAAKIHEVADYFFDALLEIGRAANVAMQHGFTSAQYKEAKDAARQRFHAAVDKTIDFAMEDD